jgi:cytochrome c biogenesis protein CcmG/thiol:disulfide interchange protein DsbE
VTRWSAPSGVLVSLVLLVGCTSTSTPSGTRTLRPDPQRSALVAKADLDPCPTSAGSSVQGGLPDVTLPCLGAGPAVHLAGLTGKPTVVNIWGSWCGPCQRETPFLSQAYDALKSKVRFLGVDDEDEPDSALDFATHVSPPMRYPSVVDDNKAVLLGLNLASAVPSTVFVGRDGRVVGRSLHAYTSVAQLRADIARYLGVH